jgi:hypothetical protein
LAIKGWMGRAQGIATKLAFTVKIKMSLKAVTPLKEGPKNSSCLQISLLDTESATSLGVSLFLVFDNYQNESGLAQQLGTYAAKGFVGKAKKGSNVF